MVTGILAFEGDGRIGEYVGGYTDWLRQRPSLASSADDARAKAPASQPRPAAAPPADSKSGHNKAGHKKLSYKAQQELDALPQRIERLEMEQAQLAGEMSSPEFFRQPADTVAAAQQRLVDVEQELQTAYGRWETLESAS